MKVGSLVQCVGNQGLKNVAPPDLTAIYTVREIRTPEYKRTLGVTSTKIGILLEEIVNPSHPLYGEEFGYLSHRFREVQPPIANIEEHINENTLEPVLI